MAAIQALKNTKNRQRGAALAEFALLIPFYVIVIVGMLKLGRLFTESAILTQNSYEIARRSAETPTNLAQEAIPAFGNNLNQIWSHYSNTETLNISGMAPTYTDTAAGRQVAISVSTDLKMLPFHGAKLNNPVKTQMVAPFLLNMNDLSLNFSQPQNPAYLVECETTTYRNTACKAADVTPDSANCTTGTPASAPQACAFPALTHFTDF